MASPHVSGIFKNLCPQCLKGHVFRGIYSMNEHCTKCGFKFEKSEGYFIGAMVLSYIFGGGIAILTLLYLLFVQKEIEVLPLFLILATEILLLNPVLYRYSRLTWLHLDHALTHKGV